MNNVICSSCGTAYRVKPEAAGKTLRCKQCGNAIPVPAAPPSEGGAGPAMDFAAIEPPDDASALIVAPPTESRSRRRGTSRGAGAPAWLPLVAIGGGVAGLIAAIALILVFTWPEAQTSVDRSSAPATPNGSSSPAHVAQGGSSSPASRQTETGADDPDRSSAASKSNGASSRVSAAPGNEANAATESSIESSSEASTPDPPSTSGEEAVTPTASLSREFAEMDGLALRPPAGWSLMWREELRRRRLPRGYADGLMPWQSTRWKSPRGKASLNVTVYKLEEWVDQQPEFPLDLRYAEKEQIGPTTINGVRMMHFQAEQTRQSHTKWDVYVFNLGDRRVSITLRRDVQSDDRHLPILRRAVQTTVRRTTPQFASAPKEGASLPDWSAKLAGSDRGRHLLLNASLAMPQGYAAEFPVVTETRHSDKHELKPDEVLDEKMKALKVEVERGEGQSRWPRLLVAGATPRAPDEAVPAYNKEIEFGKIAGVRFARLKDASETGWVRYVGHLDGDRFSFWFRFSPEQPKGDRLVRSIVHTFRPVPASESATTEAPLVKAPLRSRGWEISPPRGHWVERSDEGTRDKRHLIELNTPDARGAPAVEWYVSKWDKWDSAYPPLEIEDGGYSFRVGGGGRNGNVTHVERFQQAGLTMTKVVSDSWGGDVFYMARDGDKVICFVIDVRRAGKSNLGMYDAMVRTLRRVEQ